jgi:hypothetical protein
MAFKVKDLMINYLPQAQNPQALPPCQANAPNTCACTHCTDCTGVCTEGCTACTNPTHCTHCTACTQCTHCTACTACTACTHCTHHSFICTPGITVCAATGCGASICQIPSCGVSNPCICTVLASIVNPVETPEEGLSRLAALKQQLTAQLTEVEKQEKAAEESLRPQKLQEAMDDLKKQRAELEKKEKKG